MKETGLGPNFESLTQIKKRKDLQNFFARSKGREKIIFGFCFMDFIKIEKGGEYTFYINSDDGSKQSETIIINR